MPGVLFLPITLLFSCGDSSKNKGDAEVVAPAHVSVMTAQPKTVTVYDELPGRVSAYRTAEIRAQVGGIIQKKLYTEGAYVEAQTPLFQIDPEPFSADVDAATAVLTRTTAELLNAQVKYDRAKSLSAREVTSAESFNNATAALAQAKANVAEAKAILARRKLELSYATIRSPISGIWPAAGFVDTGLRCSA
jgi:multidrug efflux system membrane fusion protein